MKKLLKTKMALLILLTGLAFSCKKNENTTIDSQTTYDSTQTTVDTIAPAVDSSATLGTDQNGQNGTTGATGEGATGSGTAGSTQKGNQNVKTDSIK